MTSLKSKLLEIEKMASQVTGDLPARVAFSPKGKYTGGTPAASPAGTAPTGTAPAPANRGGRFTHHGPGQVAPTGTGNAVSVAGPIKNLQTAIQDFAQAVAKYSAAKPQPGQPPSPGAIDDKKKPFNDFIVTQYVSGSPVKGEEYNTSQTATNRDSKQPTDLLEMNVVLDTLRRIGSPKNELVGDNVWDFRTNNALKNVFAFAHGLVNLSKDFGKTNVQSFSQEDLDQMQSLIPEDRNPAQMPMAEKVEKAKQLIPLINKLTRFYKYYVEAIAMHPQYTRFTSKNEPMLTLQKGGGDPTQLDANQQKLMGQSENLFIGNQSIKDITARSPINVPSPKGTTGEVGIGSVPLAALQDINHLRAFMINIGYQQNQTGDRKYQKAVLDAIVNHIKNVLAFAKTNGSTG